MASEQFTNFAQTTLNTTMNNSVTSVVVTSATGFPTVPNFRINIENEIILVTAVSGTTFTVTRGAESTSAASHNAGVTVTHVLTAGSLAQTIADQNVGYPLMILPPGVELASTSIGNDAGFAVLTVCNIPAPMYVDKLGFQVTTSGSSTSAQWGLFDFHSSATAATKLAGGTGGLTSTGYQTIAASGAPVLVQPGGYALIYLNPSSNNAQVRRTLFSTNAGPFQKFQAAYSWSDTPNLTSGWSTDGAIYNLILHGRLASGTTW